MANSSNRRPANDEPEGVRDSHKGPLSNQGKPAQNLQKRESRINSRT
jgi:hypothetical protein